MGSYDTMSKEGKVFASHAVTAWHNKVLKLYLRYLNILTNAVTAMRSHFILVTNSQQILFKVQEYAQYRLH